LIPQKYIRQYSDLTLEQKKEVLCYINKNYNTCFDKLEDVINQNLSLRLQLFNNVSNNIRKNELRFSIANFFRYATDMLKELIYNRGFIMTLSGVDGAGKSTIIESLKQKFEKKFRKKVVILRHRPSLFPILSSYVVGKDAAEEKAANTLPRQGTNKSIVGSIVRFAYYFLDYQIGQIYVFIKYVSRGYVVIYDRYYFDFIQDGKRTNINLPSSFTGFLYRFIYKPQLNVLLYASPDVILARKQELSAQEITEMTYSYRELFGQLSRRYEKEIYLTIENIHQELTIDKIIENYCDVA
jgi:thymidylate kinase